MKKFNLGFLLGVTTTLGALAGAVFTFKKNVVEPIEEKEAIFFRVKDDYKSSTKTA